VAEALEVELSELSSVRFPGIVGRSAAMAALFGQMEKVAASDVVVHVFGETGTGKECVARAIHAASPRARAPFVALNASSLSDELFESEMFGHVRGAFTGAVTAREGQVAAAEGGTLFLDEVVDLTARSQARLLRFLQEGEYRRVGETAFRRANVRVVTAANLRLGERVARGAFREDLLYRINVVTLTLPPLRERRDDIVLLARRFLHQTATKWGLPVPEMTREVALALQACSWPGNVRQLQNEMERLLALCSGGALTVDRPSSDVLLATHSPSAVSQLRQARADFDRRYVQEALLRHGGNRTRTAAALGVSRQGLGLLLSRHGLSELC
jgi:DNA-binding NtrC family response regulator